MNNGPVEERLRIFLDAVRVIYASTMSREALAYREKKGVLANDEQMALLVQRVSGTRHKKVFLPELAGVGVSYNPYTWDETISPEAGLIRLVYGLGTRAVDRHDDDYTRIVSLSAPDKKPEGAGRDALKYTQKRVDVLDLAKNSLETAYFTDIMKDNPDLHADMFSSEMEHNGTRFRAVSFDHVISRTDFIKDMCEMLQILKKAYGTQVDIEFTVNFSSDGKTYRVNLLQCRPQNVVSVKPAAVIPGAPVVCSTVLLESGGGIVGRSRTSAIDRIIYIVPSTYGLLPEKDRHALAKVIGKLAHHEKRPDRTLMLIGPGRWCTRMPALGIPVSFSEINTASVICELEMMHGGLNPDLSMGTHFFNDMVELDILYMGVFSSGKGNSFTEISFDCLPDIFEKLLPHENRWKGVIKVIDSDRLPGGKKLYVAADPAKQAGSLYIA